jgi:hypothetical protein
MLLRRFFLTTGLCLGVLCGLAGASFPSIGWAKAPKASPKTAKAMPKATRPPCPLKCEEGFRPIYTFFLHPKHTVYDENGKEMVPEDGLWEVSCALRCEKNEGQHNEHLIVKDQKTALCTSGAEPAPYTGPWRITDKWTRECAAIYPDGCGLSCYPIKPPPVPQKAKGQKSAGKKPAKPPQKAPQGAAP